MSAFNDATSGSVQPSVMERDELLVMVKDLMEKHRKSEETEEQLRYQLEIEQAKQRDLAQEAQLKQGFLEMRIDHLEKEAEYFKGKAREYRHKLRVAEKSSAKKQQQKKKQNMRCQGSEMPAECRGENAAPLVQRRRQAVRML